MLTEESELGATCQCKKKKKEQPPSKRARGKRFPQRRKAGSKWGLGEGEDAAEYLSSLFF